jgi:hypothetical protein
LHHDDDDYDDDNNDDDEDDDQQESINQSINQSINITNVIDLIAIGPMDHNNATRKTKTVTCSVVDKLGISMLN